MDNLCPLDSTALEALASRDEIKGGDQEEKRGGEENGVFYLFTELQWLCSKQLLIWQMQTGRQEKG